MPDVCKCTDCKAFRMKVPTGEPLLSSLIELPGAEKGWDSFSLCSLNQSSDQGREFEWDEEDRDLYDELPGKKDISIGLFLVRKRDSKRIELSANATLVDARFKYEWDDSEWDESKEPFGDSFFEWDLSMKHVQSRVFKEMFDKVRFEAQIHWEDGKERKTPPSGLDDDELDDWHWDNPHEPELLLSSLDICMLKEKVSDVYAPWGGEPIDQRTEARPGPDELLDMLRSPLVEDRWV